MTFTEQQLKNFARYRKVQMSGKYNMFDPRARAATGLNHDDFLFVLENFGELHAAVEGEKNEDK